MAEKTAITPTRAENFPEWYQQVVKAADLAENSPVRGCMVIKPWGWGIWENLQRELDKRIKATGHENAYFPLFIPLSFMEKEAEHVDGFAKECAVVTHHRLEQRDGKLVPAGELDEPLIVRPTSETIIGEMFAKWINSYRDLPLLINQWANVVRWEMRPRLFLRTTEFLWQEGHTAHATEAEAREEVEVAAEIYRQVIEDVLAIPVIVGEKSKGERFPGAVTTVSLEAMMQDGKALQAGTSHYLGQNFAKSAGIRFLNSAGEHEFVHTTSWGASTRLVGGLVMTHGDDDGLRVPPRIAPKHVVILPVIPKDEQRAEVLAYAERVAEGLRGQVFHGRELEVTIDKRDLRGGEKNWQWVKKGIPLRVEVGPRDAASDGVVVYRRDKSPKEKLQLSREALSEQVLGLLDEIQNSYYSQALEFRSASSESGISNVEEFKKYFAGNDNSGFVLAKWSEDEQASASILAELKVTVRCLPREQSSSSGKCVLTERPATVDAVFAKAY